MDAYRRGEADAWLTALLLGACRDKAGYATVREILLLPGRAGSEHAGSALAKIGGYIRDGNFYYAIVKDERYPTLDWTTGKTIRIARSSGLLGPYSEPGPPISPNSREAPTCFVC